MTRGTFEDGVRAAIAETLAMSDFSCGHDSRHCTCERERDAYRFVADHLEDALLTGTDTAAARDVLAERQRQISAEGWTPEHDNSHGAGQMALAAGCYAMFASVSDSQRASTDMPGGLASLGKPIRGWAAWLQLWPWDRKWWKPTDRRRDLVKAGALILAEIERLDRADLVAQ